MPTRRRIGGFVPEPTIGRTIQDIARAFIEFPALAQQQKQEQEAHDLRQRQGEQQLRAGEAALEGAEAEAARADFDERKGAFLEGFGDVEGKLQRAAEARLLDPSTPEGREQDLSFRKTESEIAENEAQAARARRPPPPRGSGTPGSAKPFGRDERGRMTVLLPDGRVVLGGSNEEVRGPVFAADVNKGARTQLGSLTQVAAALDTIDARFDESDSISFVNAISKGDSLLRLQAAVQAIATPLGRALGEGRITDQDRAVYSALIGGGPVRQTLAQLGMPVESVRESVRKLRGLIGDIQGAIQETEFNMSGSRLDLPASRLNDPDAPAFGAGDGGGDDEEAAFQRIFGGQ